MSGVLGAVVAIAAVLLTLLTVVWMAYHWGKANARKEPLEEHVKESDEEARNRARDPGWLKYLEWLRRK